MAKYERYFPELKKQLTEFEDRLAMLMQYTTWDLQQEESLRMFREAAADIKKMVLKEWKDGWNSKTRAIYEAGKADGKRELKKQGMAAAEPQPALNKWEYMVVRYKREDLDLKNDIYKERRELLKHLDYLGGEGFELVSVADGYLFLKRRKDEVEEDKETR